MRQTRTGRRDGHRDGARALVGMVRAVNAANVALTACVGAFALHCGAFACCFALALACAVSVAMVRMLKGGRDEN